MEKYTMLRRLHRGPAGGGRLGSLSGFLARGGGDGLQSGAEHGTVMVHAGAPTPPWGRVKV